MIASEITIEELKKLLATTNRLYKAGWIGQTTKMMYTALIDLSIESKKPDCSSAEWCGGKCCGYGKHEWDDEPIDACKNCPNQASYGIE